MESQIRSTKLKLQKAQEKQAARDRVLLQRTHTEERNAQATLEEAAYLCSLTGEIDAATQAIRAHQEWRDTASPSWWRRFLTARRTSRTTLEQSDDPPQDVSPVSLSADDTQTTGLTLEAALTRPLRQRTSQRTMARVITPRLMMHLQTPAPHRTTGTRGSARGRSIYASTPQ
ncbi:uncharacterized protein LOC123512224 [Portunus trituberculatus]|uniref:uncharacterized protein LOC123512224 n=1 Tax=Portunus trituberculatus TaxID=210409 RepID=UPI001E1CE6CB|nr:uncharacterized protein LOC123512224 [Portunus trituberculatus]